MESTVASERRIRFSGPNTEETRPLLSVVVPVFNEEECLSALHQRLTSSLASIHGDYEIIFVNDGSHDESLPLIRSMADKDSRVGYCSFSRNFGHEAATTCGLKHARGQAVVLIDADMQDPPEVILEMLEKWRLGYDIVYGQRHSRAGETLLTRSTSHLFYRLLRQLAKVDIPVDTGDFRLMDAKVVEAFLDLPEKSRFVRGMISWTGFRQTSVPFHRDSRLAGETKYNFVKRLGLAIDAICGMSPVPLRAISAVGAVVAAFSLLLALFAVVSHVNGKESSSWALTSAGFFLASVQLFSLGLLGEYIGRIYVEVQGRPLYILAESESPRSRYTPLRGRMAS